MTRLPHRIGATDIKTTTSGIPFPDNLPVDGQILTYSGIVGSLTWANQEASGSSLETRDENFQLHTDTAFIDFVGAGVTATVSGEGIRVNIPGGGGGGSLEIRDENGQIAADAEFIDFAGRGVTATSSGLGVHVQIPSLLVKDEGINISNPTTSINFTGGGVTATANAGNVTVDIGGPLSTARGDYIHVTGTTLQNYSNGVDLTFNTTVQQRGSLQLVSNQIQGLKAGRTYLIVAHAQGGGSTESPSSNAEIYNVTAASSFSAAYVVVQRPNDFNGTGILPTASTIFAPLVDTTVSLRWASGGDSSNHIERRSLEVIEIGAVQANIIGGLEFMDKITVTANATSVVFGSAGNGAFLRALDGDVDETYVINFSILKGTTSVFDIRPNGLTSNLSREKVLSDGGTVTGGSASSWDFTGSGGALDRFSGSMQIRAKTGIPRSIFSSSVDMDVGAGDVRANYMVGMWDDTTTNITSFSIVSSQANGILAGSTFELYRITSQNTRADSASTHERNIESAVDPSEIGRASCRERV